MFLEREPEFRKSRSSEFQPVVADGKKTLKSCSLQGNCVNFSLDGQ